MICQKFMFSFSLIACHKSITPFSKQKYWLFRGPLLTNLDRDGHLFFLHLLLWSWDGNQQNLVSRQHSTNWFLLADNFIYYVDLIQYLVTIIEAWSISYTNQTVHHIYSMLLQGKKCVAFYFVFIVYTPVLCFSRETWKTQMHTLWQN